MQFELIINNPCVDSRQLQQIVFSGIDSKVSSIVVPSGLINLVKDIYPSYKYSAIVDYPYGISSPELKIHEIIEAAKKGVDTFDLVINQYHINNLEYKKILKEVLVAQSIMSDYKSELRCVIEHRLESLSKNINVCQMLANAGIREVVLSTGSLIEHTTDAIINCYNIKKKAELDVIVYSHAWNKRLLEILDKAGGHTARTNSVENIR